MYRNFHYRIALILLTTALVSVSVGYWQEHQWALREQQQLSRWERAGSRLKEDAQACMDYINGSLDSQYPPEYNDVCRAVTEVSLSDPEALISLVKKQNEIDSMMNTKEYGKVVGEMWQWHRVARDMSQEADRRHLDKSFPRVKD